MRQVILKIQLNDGINILNENELKQMIQIVLAKDLLIIGKIKEVQIESINPV